MSDQEKEPRRPDQADEERQIRRGRKFSLAEAIGRLAGPNLLKGASPVTRKRRAELEIERYLERHLKDGEGALEVVLLRRVRDSEILLQMGYGQPLAALARFVERILSSEELLRRFVNEVDAQWGRIYQERPYFQKEGQPPHAQDPYTLASVGDKLRKLLEEVKGQ